MIKFLADMGRSPRTVNCLTNQGYDAIHLVEQGLEKLPEQEILTKAQNEQRIILTLDLDFGYLLATTQSSLPSVILFRLGNESREIVEAKLIEVLEQYQNDLLAGSIISVSDDAIRVRRLPI